MKRKKETVKLYRYTKRRRKEEIVKSIEEGFKGFKTKKWKAGFITTTKNVGDIEGRLIGKRKVMVESWKRYLQTQLNKEERNEITKDKQETVEKKENERKCSRSENTRER